jgi:phospholipid/cholesterol/gamma-HCH transport system substrate-binding protein
MLRPNQTITITQSSISLEQLLGKFIFSLTNTSKPAEAEPPAGGATR